MRSYLICFWRKIYHGQWVQLAGRWQHLIFSVLVGAVLWPDVPSVPIPGHYVRSASTNTTPGST